MRIVATILFCCIFFSVSNTVVAQSNWSSKADVTFANASNLDTDLSVKEKQFINAVYGNKADALVYSNPDFLKSIKHLLRNRITITKVPANSKARKGKLLSQVPLANDFNTQTKTSFTTIESFNPLQYQLGFFSKGTYMYIIDNTNYVIKITSQFRK